MKDREFITSKFESENITAPESLSEDNIKARLEQGTKASDMIKLKKNKKRVFKPIISVAACFAVVIGTLATANVIHDRQVEKKLQSQVESGLVHFTSYDEISTFTEDMDVYKNDTVYNGLGLGEGGASFYEKSDAEVDGGVGSADAETAKSSSDASGEYSDTYKQVDGVDEADIVKTDGKYIYALNTTDENTIDVYEIKNGKAESLTNIYIDDNYGVHEMYLDGERIYVLGEKPANGGSNTFVITYDIRNRNSFEEIDRYEQSGDYSTSRFADGNIYVVSNTYAYKKDYIPFCTDGNKIFKRIPAEDICAFECCKDPNYVVVGAVDTKSGKSNTTKTKAVMGDADNIYCTTENLYISCADYRDGKLCTNIVKYALDGIKLTEMATGSVKGYVNNQWSFDEKDGYLRVATTADNSKGEEINKLFVLDKNLKKVGSVVGYAKGEHIEAVKYIGDMAYVITYKTTDPLFIIDLSNPKNPHITGSVKISGFSTNLVPVGKDKLMGIGWATEDDESVGEIRSGVKLVLFDISDKNNPKVLDEKEYPGATSPAQFTHKAILKNDKQNYLAIPVEDWSDTGDYRSADEYFGGSIVFAEKNGKIKIISEHKSNYQPDRLVYVDNTIYEVANASRTVDSFTVK